MEDYQTRVIDEYAELEEKTEKLADFLKSEEYEKVSIQERSYLEAQLPLMRKLLAVLKSRCEMYATAVDKPEEEDPDA